MKIRMFVAGVAVAVSAQSALAAGPYIGAAGGVSFFHDSDINVPGFSTVTASYKTGYGINVSGGYNFDGARVEGEFGYRAADMENLSGAGGSVGLSGVDATIESYMVNGYYDVKTTSTVTPYLGAGLGVINGELNDNGYKKDDTVFGYQIIAGAGFKIDRNVTFDISYRFQGAASDLEIDGGNISYTSSNLYAGIRYNF